MPSGPTRRRRVISLSWDSSSRRAWCFTMNFGMGTCRLGAGAPAPPCTAPRQAFRLVVQRWPKRQLELFDPDPYEYHAIATNREESAEEVVDLHNQRGEVENYIKEVKTGFGRGG